MTSETLNDCLAYLYKKYNVKEDIQEKIIDQENKHPKQTREVIRADIDADYVKGIDLENKGSQRIKHIS